MLLQALSLVGPKMTHSQTVIPPCPIASRGRFYAIFVRSREKSAGISDFTSASHQRISRVLHLSGLSESLRPTVPSQGSTQGWPPIFQTATAHYP